MRVASFFRMVCVLLALALPGAARAQFVGAAALFGLERVTVVYAASPGTDVATNRLCAERRAAYLRHKHGVEATVVPDSAVSPEQLSGDLLAIGWDNHLLGTERAPKPFGQAATGRLFLGGIRVGEGEDLLFATASPYNPERLLVFWSRTDVEIDRYLPMPFTGSDWAVFRDCTILRQGNFENRSVWPPSRNPNAEHEQSLSRGKLSAERKSARYTLHYAPDSLSSSEIERVLAAREAALRSAIGFLADPGPEFRIDLFVYADRATKRAETDVNDVVHSIPAARAMYVTTEYAAAPSPHEEIHLVARALWGPSFHTALYEGLAVALERPADLDPFAAVVVDRGAPPSPTTLLDEEALRAMSADASAFPSAGLFVRWMIDTGGLDLVRRVYSAKPLTPDGLAAALGGGGRDPNAEFASWVKARAASVDPTFRYQAALADSDRLLAAGDPARARVAAQRALTLRPKDPVGRLKLAAALSAAGEQAEAETTLRELLTLPAEGETLPYVVHAHYQLAQVLESSGRHDEAKSHYDAILELPDVGGSHRAAQDGLGSKP